MLTRSIDLTENFRVPSFVPSNRRVDSNLGVVDRCWCHSMHVVVNGQDLLEATIFNEQSIDTFVLRGTRQVVDIDRLPHDGSHLMDRRRFRLDVLGKR